MGISIVFGIKYQVEKNYVATFNKFAGVYTLQKVLVESNNNYYLVAETKGERRPDRLIKVTMKIEGHNYLETFELTEGDLRTINCPGKGYCKEQVLKGVTINETDFYKIEIHNLQAVGRIDINSLHLHSNHGIAIQALSIIIGIVLILVSFVLMIFGLIQMGYNKAMQSDQQTATRFSDR